MSNQKARFTFKVLLLGSASVGKTALVNRFVQGKFIKEYLLTIGFEPSVKFLDMNGEKICFSIWDIAGEERFQAMRSNLYRGARASILTFDLSRAETLQSIRNWAKEANEMAPDQLLILVGNKNDLERQVTRDEAEAMAQELGAEMYIETSALTGDQVDEAFTSLGQSLYDRATT